MTTPTAENKTLGTGVDTIATGAGDDVINAGLDGANQTLGALIRSMVALDQILLTSARSLHYSKINY